MDRAQRKALTQAYKLAFPSMGILAIRNRVTGRMLIESSAHLTGTINRHRTELALGTHRNKALMHDWRLHGEDGFAFEVLATVEERPEPDYDYKAELARLLARWLAEVRPGSPASYA